MKIGSMQSVDDGRLRVSSNGPTETPELTSVRQLQRRIKHIRPPTFVTGLKAGVVSVAIVKPGVNTRNNIDVNEVFWAKCPGSKTVATLLKAFAQVDKAPVKLFQEYEVLDDTQLVSSLVTNDNICVIEAVHENAAALDYQHKSSTPSTNALQDITSNAVNRTTPVHNHGSKQNWSRGSSKSGTDSPFTVFSTRTNPPAQSHTPSTPSRSKEPSGAPVELAWIDFVYDRRECCRRPDSGQTHLSQIQVDSYTIREWRSLSSHQRQYYVDRAQKHGFSSLQEHRAFWVFYYHRSELAAKRGIHHHATFDTTTKFLAECYKGWMHLNEQMKQAFWISPNVKHCALQVPSLPLLSDLPFTESQSPVLNQWSARSPPTDSSLLEPEVEQEPETITETKPIEETLPDKLNVAELFEGRSIEQLEEGMSKSADILTSIKTKLELEPSEESTHWLTMIATLEKQTKRTRTIVGVVGATGAGKSSVINAILDQERLVPTNCMRACTAVVTEISYNHDEIPFRAEIDFISRDEWAKELKTSFLDLIDGSGKVSREHTNEDSEAGIAYAKIKSVYPSMTNVNIENATINDLLEHKNVRDLLGSSHGIEDEGVSAFYKKLQQYVDSKEKVFSREKRSERQMEFWPLIKVVRLYVKAPALATGAVIVDLPGVHDSNQARAAVAQGYLKQCTGLWIVAPITRAVDDKSAKTLLGDTFKRQLKMDGGYSSVTFICSKTDDISITEAQDSLGLDDEMAPLYTRSDLLHKELRKFKKELDEMKEKRTNITDAMDSLDEQLEVWENLASDLESGKMVYAPVAEATPNKRKRDERSPSARKRPKYAEADSDDDFVLDDDSDTDSDIKYRDNEAFDPPKGDPLSVEAIEEKLSEFKASKKEGRRERTTLEQSMTELRAKMMEIEKERNEIDDELLGRCIKGRNEYSRGAIQQDFASGIRELDQEIAEEEDAANFNPDLDARDYEAVAKSLPVFCVSSRGYQQLMGRLTKDKKVTTFVNVEDTEVPALQVHCQKLTVTNREVSCKRFLNNLSQFLNSLKLWSSSDGTAAHLSDDQQRREAEFLDSQLKKLDTALEKAVSSICTNLNEEIQDQLYEKFPTAVQAGKSEANDIQARWGSNINRDNRDHGGLYWSTYKATVRRDGTWKNNNFNNDLTEPVIKLITPGWEKVFARRLPHILAGLAGQVHQLLANFHVEIEQRAIKNGMNIATFQMLKQQLSAYREIAKDASNITKDLINAKQKDINREFVPIVTTQMAPVYQTTTAETGPGQYQRMKDAMATFVSQARDTMFEDSLNHVRQLLQQMVKTAEETMMSKLDEVFMAVKRDYESVVVGQSQASALDRKLSTRQRKTRKDILDIIDGVEDIMERIVDSDSAESNDIAGKPGKSNSPQGQESGDAEDSRVESTENRESPQDGNTTRLEGDETSVSPQNNILEAAITSNTSPKTQILDVDTIVSSKSPKQVDHATPNMIKSEDDSDEGDIPFST